MTITQRTDSKADFPRSWNFKKDGALAGRHRELRAVKAPDYTTGEPVDKVVWEAELAKTGEAVSVWLDNKVLFSAFADELKARKQKGKTLEPSELITITPLGLVQPKTSSGKPFNGYTVVFEHEVPSLGAEEILLGAGLDEKPAAPPTSGQLGPDDEIPF